jgi:hypothetical protein
MQPPELRPVPDRIPVVPEEPSHAEAAREVDHGGDGVTDGDGHHDEQCGEGKRGSTQGYGRRIR